MWIGVSAEEARRLDMFDKRIDTLPLEVTGMRKLILIGVEGLMLARPGRRRADEADHRDARPGLPPVLPRRRTGSAPVRHNGHSARPVALVNLDEAALKIVGPGSTKIERVGANLTLKANGVYTITMVGQAPDDQHLKLTIK
jgi:hypothetical protein